jgi:hypothetical protein
MTSLRTSFRAASLVLTVSAIAVVGLDVQVMPPMRREFPSTNKRYSLIAEVPEGWQYAKVRLSFYKSTEKGKTLVWDLRCIHRLGPKDVFVSPSGSVVLIEEWTTENADCALWLLDSKGKIVVKHNIDAIRQVLKKMGVDGISRNVWRESGPTLSTDGTACVFGTKHGDFRMDLTTGELSRQPPK